MSPTIAGLILSIPLSWASGQLWLGLGMKRIGLLRTPEETSPPEVIERANALAAELARSGHDDEDALIAIHADPALRAIHEAFLPEKPRHRLGDVDVDAAVGAAKLNDAETIEDAIAWLKPRERVAVLADRALIAMLARLPSAADAATRPVDA
jgi:membrane glycosyltransferase